MSYFPLMIQLDRQPVLLVGGGRTALHKARILLAFGARLQVVAPVLAPGFQDLPVQVEKRKFVPDDIVRESWRMVWQPPVKEKSMKGSAGYVRNGRSR